MHETEDFVEVFRHQQVCAVDIAINALREKGIPCYMQQSAITGIVLAPVLPAAGPGVEYIVFVPKTREQMGSHLSTAREDNAGREHLR